MSVVTLTPSSVSSTGSWVIHGGAGTVGTNMLTDNSEYVENSSVSWYKLVMSDASLPPGTVIEGIEVLIDGAYDSSGGTVNGTSTHARVEAMLIGAVIGPLVQISPELNSAPSDPIASAVVTIGTPTDLWGGTWVYSDADSLEVWVRRPYDSFTSPFVEVITSPQSILYASDTYSGESTSKLRILDYLSVKVYYTGETLPSPIVIPDITADGADKFVMDGHIFDIVPEMFTNVQSQGKESVTTLAKAKVSTSSASVNTNSRLNIENRNHVWQVFKADFTAVPPDMYDLVQNLYSVNKSFFIRFDEEMSRFINDPQIVYSTECYNVNESNRIFLLPTYPVKQENYTPNVNDDFEYHLYLYDGADYVAIQSGFSLDTQTGVITFDSKLADGVRVIAKYSWRAKVRILDYALRELDEECYWYTGSVLFQQVPEYNYEEENYYKLLNCRDESFVDTITSTVTTSATIPTNAKVSRTNTVCKLEGVCTDANWTITEVYSGNNYVYNSGTEAIDTTALAADGSNKDLTSSWTSITNKPLSIEQDYTVAFTLTYSGSGDPQYVACTIEMINTLLTQYNVTSTLTANEQVGVYSKSLIELYTSDNPDGYVAFNNTEVVAEQVGTSDVSNTYSETIYLPVLADTAHFTMRVRSTNLMHVGDTTISAYASSAMTFTNTLSCPISR